MRVSCGVPVASTSCGCLEIPQILAGMVLALAAGVFCGFGVVCGNSGGDGIGGEFLGFRRCLWEFGRRWHRWGIPGVSEMFAGIREAIASVGNSWGFGDLCGEGRWTVGAP